MKICPRCKHQPSDRLLLQCDKCHVAFVEEDEPVRLSEEDLDRLANRLVKALKQDEELDRIAAKVVVSLKKR